MSYQYNFYIISIYLQNFLNPKFIVSLKSINSINIFLKFILLCHLINPLLSLNSTKVMFKHYNL
jgi:hypothetical protein